MKANDRTLAYLLVGLTVVGATAYAAITRTGAPGTDSTGMPRPVEPSNRNMSPLLRGMSASGNMLGIDDNGLTMETRLIHFFHPDGPMPLNPPDQQFTDTRHRYPNVTGTNINTLIHRGYSPMMVPSKQDYGWMTQPPTESML